MWLASGMPKDPTAQQETEWAAELARMRVEWPDFCQAFVDRSQRCLPDLLEQCAREQVSPLSFLELVLTGGTRAQGRAARDHDAQAQGYPPGKPSRTSTGAFSPRRSASDRDAGHVQLYPGEDERALSGPTPASGKVISSRR